MEVGAVKHQLNNEIIHLKKKLNQAKVQLIHKLTRKANALKSDKTPAHLQARLQRKADAVVSEVLILKKVQPKELIRFAVTHEGKLENFVNKSTVDNEKVFAKILLHKAMNEQYKKLRNVFSNMPIDDLLMTRKERLKLKKTKKELTEKKVGSKNIINVIENCNDEDDKNNIESNAESQSDHETESEKELGVKCDEEGNSEVSDDESENDGKAYESTSKDKIHFSENVDENNDNVRVIPKSKEKLMEQVKTKLNEFTPQTSITTQKLAPEKKTAKKKLKAKKPSKQSRKSNDDKREGNTQLQPKVVDSFFLTTTGDHYLTLAEPRARDEVKEEHYRGNRRMRRAEMFGKTSFREKKSKVFSSKHLDSANGIPNKFIGRKNSIVDNVTVEKRKPDEKVEKLHPSWEAKKQKAGIVQFAGKKVVFS